MRSGRSAARRRPDGLSGTGEIEEVRALGVVELERSGQRVEHAVGTVIALMLPYTLVLTVAWTVFFIAWYAIGIPVGPGWPIR